VGARPTASLNRARVRWRVAAPKNSSSRSRGGRVKGRKARERATETGGGLLLLSDHSARTRSKPAAAQSPPTVPLGAVATASICASRASEDRGRCLQSALRASAFSDLTPRARVRSWVRGVRGFRRFSGCCDARARKVRQRGDTPSACLTVCAARTFGRLRSTMSRRTQTRD
jgi:hypothetical protein